MPRGDTEAENQCVHINQRREESLELFLRLIPIIIFSLSQQLLIIRLEQALSLAVILPMSLLLQLVLNFLPLVPSNVNRVAALAPAVLAPILREGGPPLQSGHLA